METVCRTAPQDPDVTILSIEGEASDSSRDLSRLVPLLKGLLSSDTRYLVVNMSGLVSIGCEALAKLMYAAILLRADGGDMTFAAADPEIAASLAKLGIDRMVQHCATVDEAIVAVRN